jgi:hypothetical protein
MRKASLYEDQKENIKSYIESNVYSELVKKWNEALTVNVDDAALKKTNIAKLLED